MTESERELPVSGQPNEIAVERGDVEVQVPRTDGHTLDELIRIRAYELYHERGGQGGDDVGDWLLAESEYVERLHGTTQANPPDNGASGSVAGYT